MHRKQLIRRDPQLVKGLAAGLAGGLAGTVVMTGFQMLWNKASEALASDDDGNQEEESSEPATEKAADAIAEHVFDHELGDHDKAQAGTAVHYSMGAVSGLIYGLATELTPHAHLGAGSLFGGAVWLTADEVLVPALGLTEAPMNVPATTHVYGLVSHLVYGVATELVRRRIRQLL